MNNKSIEVMVGMFVLAGIAALAFLAFRVGNLGADSGDYYTISARFDNIGGLSVRAPVRMAGVRIGRVTHIYVDRDEYSAIVEMAIDQGYDNLPVDSSASILTSGLLGAQYVGITPGGDDLFLTDGARLELSQSAVVLEQLIGQLLFSKASGDE